MGICLSSKVKAYTSSNAGLGSRDGKSLPSSSSVPQNPVSETEILPSPSLMCYSFNDLKLATRNFRPDSLLGVGGFGPVYKGWIDEKSGAPSKPDSGVVVAVKKLDKQGPQGHREWLAEINYLGQLRHPNLVKLIGYCLEDDSKMLVYEFMPRGSMENHLFRRGSHFQPLSWSIRMKVAADAARGLAFLHSDEVKVIYRDFKTSNILLDLNYNAKLSDFGLARDGPKGDRTHVSTRVLGTYGYAAPEYMATGHLTPKTDVYSFGVVLVEMLSGRRAVDRNQPPGQQNAVEWAKPYLVSKRRLLNVMDARIEGQYSLEEAHMVAALALQCLSEEARSRPTMDEVLSTLLQFQQAARQITAPTPNPSLANNHPGSYPRPSTALLFS